MGRYSTRLGVAISRETAQVRDYLSQRIEELKEYLPSRAVEMPLEGEGTPSEQPESEE